MRMVNLNFSRVVGDDGQLPHRSVDITERACDKCLLQDKRTPPGCDGNGIAYSNLPGSLEFFFSIFFLK